MLPGAQELLAAQVPLVAQAARGPAVPEPVAQVAIPTTTPPMVLSTRPATAVTVATRARTVATPVAAGTAATNVVGQEAKAGDGDDVSDWTSQKARASADGGTNRTGYVDATQTANPTTTTTSTATQSGTGGAGGDTVGAVNETGAATTGGNDTAVYGGDIVAMRHGCCLRERRRSDRRHGQRERRGGHGWRLGGQQHVGRDPELGAGHDPVVELAEVVVGLLDRRPLDQRQLQPQEDSSRLLLVTG